MAGPHKDGSIFSSKSEGGQSVVDMMVVETLEPAEFECWMRAAANWHSFACFSAMNGLFKA